mmetsp:Transcript_48938/g.110901  ORF Transcript_48938/g.110901 Transcript_48938/m.110901 type:complete len:187 (+) Transcript_48938:33-593(+)
MAMVSSLGAFVANQQSEYPSTLKPAGGDLEGGCVWEDDDDSEDWSEETSEDGMWASPATVDDMDVLVAFAESDPDDFPKFFPHLVSDPAFLAKLPKDHEYRQRQLASKIRSFREEIEASAIVLRTAVDGMIDARRAAGAKVLEEVRRLRSGADEGTRGRGPAWVGAVETTCRLPDGPRDLILAYWI